MGDSGGKTLEARKFSRILSKTAMKIADFKEFLKFDGDFLLICSKT